MICHGEYTLSFSLSLCAELCHQRLHSSICLIVLSEDNSAEEGSCKESTTTWSALDSNVGGGSSTCEAPVLHCGVLLLRLPV